ncbi:MULTISPECIES: DUF952 domain-containing protein [Bacillaceae]|uniref:DUF952 domain-containing protein n=1 Tax=Lentibacillus amyloliquefaciens TaxID=1472767 RepID=A0A0U4FLH2_9BACI|nr:MULTISPECIES: DUF952 domain-containing protein [Bacillaceae]ALX49502.1 hypothetical protein AOX59_13555 [Lentibacillus amyloliquefaciens]
MILHIIEGEEWIKAKEQGIYTPASIVTDGFIHCSTTEQVIEIANFLYKGYFGLVLLCIASNKVNSKIVYEDLYETGKLYPHIYGSLNVDAVFKVVEFETNSDGSFDLPYEINEIVT